MDQGTCPVCGQRIAIVDFLPPTWALPELGYLERHDRASVGTHTKCPGSFGYWKERQAELSASFETLGLPPVELTEAELAERQRKVVEGLANDPKESVIANLHLWADTDSARWGVLELLDGHGLAERDQAWIKKGGHPSGWPGYWVDPEELEAASNQIPRGVPVALLVQILRSSDLIQDGTREGLRRQGIVRQLNAHLGTTLVSVLVGALPHEPYDWARSDWPVMRPKVWERLQIAHRIWIDVESAEGQDVTRRWFIGANPLLMQRAPVVAIREDSHAEVERAARAFIGGEVDE